MAPLDEQSSICLSLSFGYIYWPEQLQPISSYWQNCFGPLNSYRLAILKGFKQIPYLLKEPVIAAQKVPES